MSKLKAYKELLAKTWYVGFYYDIRDGKRVGVEWKHQQDINHNMINEEEIKVTEAPIII
jgi:hypothetical protein